MDVVRYQIFSRQSLFQLELRDNNLHKYVMDWNKILEKLVEPPAEEELQTFFWEQIQKCTTSLWRAKMQPLLIKDPADEARSYPNLIKLVQEHLQAENNSRNERENKDAGKLTSHLTAATSGTGPKVSAAETSGSGSETEGDDFYKPKFTLRQLQKRQRLLVYASSCM